jgi:putative transposase
LRRSQRNLSRKQQGSKNREKARRRVARLQVRAADARRDFHHQRSTRLIREHQTVCVESLNVAALGRSNLATSIHDAGWGQFRAMLIYKAKQYGRTVIKVDRWFPSSQRCSACGHRDGPKPLQVRTWTCLGCGVTHDRDVNAARSILAEGRSVAACGGDIRGHSRSWIAALMGDLAAAGSPQSASVGDAGLPQLARPGDATPLAGSRRWSTAAR